MAFWKWWRWQPEVDPPSSAGTPPPPAGGHSPRAGASTGKAPNVLRQALRRARGQKVVIGLDLGTSATKAAYRVLGDPLDRVTAVRFHPGDVGIPGYCLPTVATLSGSGGALFGMEALSEQRKDVPVGGIRRLKVLVAGEVDPAFEDALAREDFNAYVAGRGLDPLVYTPGHILAAFIAWQAAAIERIVRQDLRDPDAVCQFNVCVPMDQYQRPELIAQYDRILQAAERLKAPERGALGGTPGLIEAAAGEYAQGISVDDAQRLFHALPESVAQVASYLASLEAEPGLHGVVDVGAGTTDVSVFRLDSGNGAGAVCYWFAGRNIPRGMGGIERAVVQCYLDAGRQPPPTMARLHKVIEAATLEHRIGRVVHEQVQAIERMARQAWVDAYNKLRKQTAWQSVSVFLAGGGAEVPAVGRLLTQSWMPNWPQPRIRSLPLPRNFVDLGGMVPFRRLSVAYGLTRTRPELGDFVLPDDCPDQTPPIRYHPKVPHWGDQPYPNDYW